MARVTAGTARTRGDLGFGMIVSVQQQLQRNNKAARMVLRPQCGALREMSQCGAEPAQYGFPIFPGPRSRLACGAICEFIELYIDK